MGTGAVTDAPRVLAVESSCDETCASLVRGRSTKALTISSFVSSHELGRKLGAILCIRTNHGGVREIASYSLASDEEVHFAQFVTEAQAWLESQSADVAA